MSRPIVATAATLAITAGGFVAADAPTTTPGTTPTSCSTVPADLTLTTAGPEGIAVASATGTEEVALDLPDSARVALRAPDGTWWVETGDGLNNGAIVRAAADGSDVTTVADGAVALTDVGWSDGKSAAAFLDFDTEPADDGADETNGAKIVAWSDGDQTVLGNAVGPEYSAGSLTLGAGWIAEGNYADLTETFRYLAIDGEGDGEGGEAEFINPADGAAYNAPPRWLWPALSDPSATDASTLLSWVEGPDYDAATDPSGGGEDPGLLPLIGSWTVAVADAVTGDGDRRVDLGRPQDEQLIHASFDGRFWIGVFGSAPGEDQAATPAAVIAVDFGATTPAPVDVGCPAGTVAAIDRDGAPQPAIDDEPCPDGYRQTDGELPLAICATGAPVQVVQDLLDAAGFELQIDGEFGPATRDAVEAFQEANGLEVDGLVGPETWSELLAMAGIADDDLSLDSNGNGRLDPGDEALLQGSAEPDGTAPDGTEPGDDGPAAGGGYLDAGNRYSEDDTAIVADPPADGIYGARASSDGETITFQLLRILSAPTCLAELPDAQLSCTSPPYYQDADVEVTITVNAADLQQATVFIGPDVANSYEVTGTELARLLSGQAPGADAPEGYGGVRDGSVFRIEVVGGTVVSADEQFHS